MIKCNMIKILTRRKYDKMLYDKLFEFFYHIYFFNMIKKKPMNGGALEMLIRPRYRPPALLIIKEIPFKYSMCFCLQFYKKNPFI